MVFEPRATFCHTRRTSSNQKADFRAGAGECLELSACAICLSRTRIYTVETQTPALSTIKGTPFVQTDNVPKAVPAKDIVINTPDAAPKNVHSHNLKITTTLRHEGWSQLLAKRSPLVKYPNIPQYIQDGADVGRSRVTRMYIHPNCSSILIHSPPFEEIITRKLTREDMLDPSLVQSHTKLNLPTEEPNHPVHQLPDGLRHFPVHLGNILHNLHPPRRYPPQLARSVSRRCQDPPHHPARPRPMAGNGCRIFRLRRVRDQQVQLVR